MERFVREATEGSGLAEEETQQNDNDLQEAEGDPQPGDHQGEKEGPPGGLPDLEEGGQSDLNGSDGGEHDINGSDGGDNDHNGSDGGQHEVNGSDGGEHDVNGSDG